MFFLELAADVIIRTEGRSDSLATTYVNISSIKIERKKYKEAKKLLLEAKEIYDKHIEDYNQHYHILLYDLAILSLAENDKKQAEIYLEEAETRVKDVFGEKHPEYTGINSLLEACRR